ncbi:unnamed protein product [Dicrocoelium dendriticum]|nr:unnamed protein product [Dicrocoelium dendriticum]
MTWQRFNSITSVACYNYRPKYPQTLVIACFRRSRRYANHFPFCALITQRHSTDIGGQGTRLGFHFPKGLYSPGLPSGRSLYQIQAEQLLRVAQLAQQEFGSKATIPWYIMTSEHTKECTVLYFKAHNYFGHDPNNVVFFEQFSLPVFSLDGKILMEKKYKLCTSPDGNGGLYQALKRRGILEDMSARGVEYVQIYGVDNILVKLPDLHFVGFCIAKSAECAAEVVEKVDADEPIGIVVRVDGRYRVVEYTELPREIASLRVDSEASPHTAPTQGTSPMVVEQARSRLVYSHGNICVHFVTREFLQRVCEPECLTSLNHHVAKKKVPHINLFTGESVVPTDPNGVKFEKFVFDVFPFAKSFAIWEVPRKERFSPLKNGPSASSDCPSTSRSDYLSFHASLALAAGAEFVNSPANQKESPSRDHSRTVIEISPLVSYAGENLESLKGVQLQGINLLEIDKDTGQPVLIRMTNNSS